MAGTAGPSGFGVGVGVGVDPNRGARPRCSLSLPAAPEPLSPAGGAGEEAPDEDEDEAEAEDPERPAGGSGTRGGGGGGGGGAGAGGGGGPGGALTRRAVTLRVLLKDAQLEPGAGVLSIYYLVSTPQPPSPSQQGQEGKLRPIAALQQAEPGNGEGKLRQGTFRPSTSPEGHRSSNTPFHKGEIGAQRGYHCFLGGVTSLNLSASYYSSPLTCKMGLPPPPMGLYEN